MNLYNEENMMGKNMNINSVQSKPSQGYDEEIQKSLQSWPWLDSKQSIDRFQGAFWFEMIYTRKAKQAGHKGMEHGLQQ